MVYVPKRTYKEDPVITVCGWGIILALFLFL
jgi:hypothetical protein